MRVRPSHAVKLPLRALRPPGPSPENTKQILYTVLERISNQTAASSLRFFNRTAAARSPFITLPNQKILNPLLHPLQQQNKLPPSAAPDQNPEIQVQPNGALTE